MNVGLLLDLLNRSEHMKLNSGLGRSEVLLQVGDKAEPVASGACNDLKKNDPQVRTGARELVHKERNRIPAHSRSTKDANGECTMRIILAGVGDDVQEGWNRGGLITGITAHRAQRPFLDQLGPRSE